MHLPAESTDLHLRQKPVVKILAHGAVAPTEEEVARNPRARSAKLRVAQKLEVL